MEIRANFSPSILNKKAGTFWTLIVILVQNTFGSAFCQAADLSACCQEGISSLEMRLAEWKVIQISGKDRLVESSTMDTFLEVPVSRARGNLSGKNFAQLYIQMLNNSSAGDPVFKERYDQLRQSLPKLLTEQTGVAMIRREELVPNKLPTELLGWENLTLTYALRFEPGKQVWLSIEPTSSARHKIIVEANPGLRFQLNVLRTESGDVMLKEVPVVDLMRMAFGGVSRWLTKYYDWNIQESSIDALSAKTENTYSRDLLKQFGEITGHTARTLAGFDLQEVKKQIDQGHPVVIERVLAPERTNQLMAHARARVENPAYELPSADDSEEQKKWGKQGLGLRVWLCVIVGYNQKKGEIIFSHPGFGVELKNLRMRVEEAGVSISETTLFNHP